MKNKYLNKAILLQTLRPSVISPSNSHRMHLPKLQYHKPFCFPFDYILYLGIRFALIEFHLFVRLRFLDHQSSFTFRFEWNSIEQTVHVFFSVILQNNGIILNASKSIIVIILPSCIVYNASLHL